MRDSINNSDLELNNYVINQCNLFFRYQYSNNLYNDNVNMAADYLHGHSN